MRCSQLALIILISGLILPAHAAKPKPSGYLSDYHRLVEGEYLEAWWVDMTRIKRSDEPTVILGEISVSKILKLISFTVLVQKHSKRPCLPQCIIFCNILDNLG